MFFIEAKKKIDESPDKDDLRAGSLLIAEGEQRENARPVAGSRGRRGRAKRSPKTQTK